MKLITLLMFATLVHACESKSATPDTSEPSPRIDAGPVDKAGYHTRHLDADGRPKFTNLLAKETSPYLRQHMHNPVNWAPWGDTAFAVAKATNRPILLSIGYSTCHWCHVMAEESFEDLEIAKLLNDRYVAVKVDREERPDIDALYMEAVTRIAGRGGWPATLWLTPEGEPFFAGTYLPPRAGARGPGDGFLERLTEWADKFAADPDGVRADAKKVNAAVMQQQHGQQHAGPLGDRKRVLELALQTYERSYDRRDHGWGRQKFPMPARLRFLLRAEDFGTDSDAIGMATGTLDAMADGGIFDHVAGGFHRYTVDPQWQVPHFEKMLYDNAQLVIAYTEAWQRTKSPLYKTVVRRTVEHMIRDMQASDGGFYSAWDADSEGEEGTFYVWTPAQIDAAAPDEAAALKLVYGVTDRGNFEGGTTVLHRAVPTRDAAEQLGVQRDALEKTLAVGLEKLRVARNRRVPPHRDDKILAGWNGLAIDALARAGFAFDQPEWIGAAARAEKALPTEGVKLRRSRVGEKMGPPAFADDYAFVIGGLTTLFEVTTNPVFLRRAVLLQNQFDLRYWDSTSGGYYLSTEELAGELPVRQKLIRDGAVPSANSFALLNLLRLTALRDDERLRKRTDELINAFGRGLASNPTSAPQMLLGVAWMAGDPKEVAVVGPEPEGLLTVLRTGFYPHFVLGRATSAGAIVPWLAQKEPKAGKATAYVCRNFTCKLPTTEPLRLLEQMRSP